MLYYLSVSILPHHISFIRSFTLQYLVCPVYFCPGSVHYLLSGLDASVRRYISQALQDQWEKVWTFIAHKMIGLRQISVHFRRDQNGSEGDHICEDIEPALLRPLRNGIGVKDSTIDLAWPQSVY